MKLEELYKEFTTEEDKLFLLDAVIQKKQNSINDKIKAVTKKIKNDDSEALIKFSIENKEFLEDLEIYKKERNVLDLKLKKEKELQDAKNKKSKTQVTLKNLNKKLEKETDEVIKKEIKDSISKKEKIIFECDKIIKGSNTEYK